MTPSAQAMQYERIITAALSTPWALQSSKLHSIAELLAYRASGQRFTDDEIRERIAHPAHAAAPMPTSQGGSAVAVLPIVGTITQRADMMTETSGGATTDSISAQFAALIDNPQVRAVILDVDSPGGSTYGVMELADQIFQARGSKPIVAVANSVAASAAFWIAAAAGEFVCTPSGEVGSVGVWAMHQDMSAALEAAGVKVTLVSAGKYKTEQAPFGPLSAEALAYVQQGVDQAYAQFTGALAKYRGTAVSDVRDNYGQGRMLSAKDALTAGMIDRVDTMQNTIARMMRPGAAARSQRSTGAMRFENVIDASFATDWANSDDPTDDASDDAPQEFDIEAVSAALAARLKEGLNA